MPINITTAVDSLVELVNNKQRISLEDAAKELGIPANIINEWATFLEEENILTIEYKFTKPFLVAKSAKITIDIKELENELELITRKLEYVLSNLEKQQIKHEIKIESLDDIKALVRKGDIFNQKKLNNNIVYAQKFILEFQIKTLLNKIRKIKKVNLEIINELKDKLAMILKRKNIFDDNLKMIK
ncbi:MAG: hypothetical protein AABX55_00815 [Nanoarchaeota archaeon]